MDDLSTVTTEDLVDEIFRRHDAAVVMGFQNLSSRTERRYGRWKGNFTAIGLCKFMENQIVRDLLDDTGVEDDG